MEDVKCSRGHVDECSYYLRNLSVSKNVRLFSLKHFEKLFSRTQELGNCDKNLTQDCTILLTFLKETEKQYRLSCDIACAFCIVLSSRIRNILQLCLTILKKHERLSRELVIKSEELTSLLKKYPTILLAGILKYLITNRSLAFENEEEFSTFLTYLNEHIFEVLSAGGDLYALLCVVELLLDLAAVKNVMNSQLLDNISSTVMCVVMNFWNHHISEIRARVHRLSITCLKLNYEDAVKKTRYRNTLMVILNLKLFKAFANDMFWSVPYKYFAYSAGLEFYAQFSDVSKFLLRVKIDLQEGFNRSLQNKRVIGSETDLFKFCTQNLSLEEWLQIFQSVVDRVISSNNIVTANNFSRYWLPVILKKYPEYAETLWSKLPNGCEQRSAPHSKILFALLKVCYKYNIRLPVNDTDEHFLGYLESCFADAEDSRGELFSLLCNLREQSVVPSEHELRLVLRFLRINAHSSSTILRQQVFSSFATFVLRIHCSGVKALKTDKYDKLDPLLTFLKDFSSFLVDGMQPGRSYQRKITSLTLYKIFMTYAIASSGGDLRRNNLKDTEKFVSWVKERGYWRFTNDIQFTALFRCLMDTCSEIQNISFRLLKSYFDMTSVRIRLFDEVSVLMRSNLFYKRQSGVAVVLSVICLAYNTGPDAVCELLVRPEAEYSTFTDMFSRTLQKQIDFMKKDMLYSAVYEPLDATIKVLTYLVADTDSPEFEIATENQIELLIGMLEDIVPLLLRALFVDDFADYAPSFEESDKALQRIIENSQITDQLELEDSKEDEFQLKPLYQILMNYIWISLKACCECESKLVVSKGNLKKSLVIRCCDLITKKLKLCRHKGVIEAAGITLSDVVQVLTARNICGKWLDNTLMSVINLIVTKNSASVSRKSAGLSLLIQTIVGNDKRASKPLLSKCWTEFRRVLDVDYEKIDVNVSRELPQTHALHFLRVLIADARNSAALLPYFENITLLCLQTLRAPFWIIRNASLQLFGAILPKIVGQKNTQNDFGVRRSFEEIFSCMPRLLDYIILSLRESERDDSSRLISHSNLVPLLVLLSNGQVGSVSTMEKSFRFKLLELRMHLKLLLGSELFHVRKLAGKAFISLHSKEEVAVFQKINDNIVQRVLARKKTENLTHGQLLMLKQVFSVHAEVRHFRRQVLENLTIIEAHHIKSLEMSMMSETLFIGLGIKDTHHSDCKVIVKDMKTILNTLNTERHKSMGYEEWTRTLLRKMFEKYDSHSIVEVLEVCLNDSNLSIVENTLKALCSQVVFENKADDIIELLCRCMEYHLISRSNSVIRVAVLNRIFKVLLRIPPSKFDFVKASYCSKNFGFLKNLSIYEYQANNLRILCLFLTSSHPLWMNEVLVKLRSILRMNRYSRDIRLNAAEGVKLLCNIRCQNAENLELLWKIFIDMVCDEEADIRSVGCRCVQLFKPSVVLCSPDEATSLIFNFNFMEEFLVPEIIVDKLLAHICVIEHVEFFASMKYSNDEIANPFDQGTDNTYREDIEIISLCGKTIHYLINANKKEYFSETEKLTKYFSHLDSIVQTCDLIVQSKFLVTGEIYTIATRYYYLLFIAAELLKQGFVSKVGNYELSNSERIICAYTNLKDSFIGETLYV